MPTDRVPPLVTAAFASALILAVAGTASPDEVVLKTGGRVSGMVVERTRDHVVVETGPGRVTLAMSRVQSITQGASALATYRERAATVDPSDPAAWAALARWAEAAGLTTQAREAWQRVLDLEPNQPQANQALGRQQVDGRWLERDDAYRAQGLVPYEGRWVTPAEHEALLRERAVEDAERRERRENEARVREAEARADEAEARAREAEAASQAGSDDGIPYWWGYGGGVGVPPGGHRPDGPSAGHEPRPRPPQRPPVTNSPPSTIGGAGTRPSKPAQPGGLVPPSKPRSQP